MEGRLERLEAAALVVEPEVFSGGYGNFFHLFQIRHTPVHVKEGWLRLVNQTVDYRLQTQIVKEKAQRSQEDKGMGVSG